MKFNIHTPEKILFERESKSSKHYSFDVFLSPKGEYIVTNSLCALAEYLGVHSHSLQNIKYGNRKKLRGYTYVGSNHTQFKILDKSTGEVTQETMVSLVDKYIPKGLTEEEKSSKKRGIYVALQRGSCRNFKVIEGLEGHIRKEFVLIPKVL